MPSEFLRNTLSFHLKELANAGLVTQERSSRNIVYRAAYDHMNALLAYLTANCCQGVCLRHATSLAASCKLLITKENPMKRFHVHAHVDDLPASIAFYTKMFGAEPARVETDYAKWMIEDPRINFAISTRGGKAGRRPPRMQTDTEEELAELKERARAADMSLSTRAR